MYEATEAVLHYAQYELGLHRIIAITSADNSGSLTLLPKLGLRFEKTARLFGKDVLLLAVDFSQ